MDRPESSDRPVKLSSSIELQDDGALFALMLVVNLGAASRHAWRFPVRTEPLGL